MQAQAFWKIITMDEANLLGRMISLLDENHIQYCVIGGQAVNAYVDPLVSLDLDLAVSVDQLDQLENLLSSGYKLKRFAHSLNVSMPNSDLRVQIQTDPRYAEFVRRAERRMVLGVSLPVASLEDVLRGKIWAVQDVERRSSKRQKDLADIARIIESYPNLRGIVPDDVLARLM